MDRCDKIRTAQQKPPEGDLWVQERLTKKQVTARPGIVCPEEWSRMLKKSQRKAFNEWAEEKPELDAARERRGIYFTPDDEPDNEDIMNNARRNLDVRRASAVSCKGTTPVNPNGSRWGPCASWV